MALLPYFSVLFSLSIFVIAECSRKFPSTPIPLSLQHSFNPAPTPLSLQHSSNWKRTTVLTITTATMTIASLIVIIILLCKRYSRENQEQCEQQSANVNILIAKDSVRYFQEGHTMFKFDDLLSVESKMIRDKRETAKGSSYKVVLENGRAFVIKRLNPVVPQKSELAPFEAHINKVAAITGPHIVNIRAFFFNEEERLLVYDYMPMGSLDALLHQNVEYRLQWKICWIIALGVAKGIKRIHKKSDLHGNVRSTNILFGPSYDIRVSENGLFDLVAYKDDSATSENSDIYSFGLVLLELLSRKNPTQWDRHLLQFAVDNYEPEIEGQPEVSEYLNHYIDTDLLREEGARLKLVLLIRLALECAVENNGNVSMSEIVRQIENIGVHGYRYPNLDMTGSSKSHSPDDSDEDDSDEDRGGGSHVTSKPRLVLPVRGGSHVTSKPRLVLPVRHTNKPILPISLTNKPILPIRHSRRRTMLSPKPLFLMNKPLYLMNMPDIHVTSTPLFLMNKPILPVHLMNKPILPVRHSRRRTMLSPKPLFLMDKPLFLMGI